MFKEARELLPVIVLAFIAGLTFLSFTVLPPGQADGPNAPTDTRCQGLKYQEKCFPLEIAGTLKDRVKGLSGRSELPENTGMLFVFGKPKKQCIWMKDMNFSLDIIWLDEHKEVIKVEKNVSPETFPESFCAEDTKYVMEFEAGFANEYGLKTGTTLQF